ncbi:MAG TPA: mechanosensitive ion channel family protein [Gaiellaceae bacterium]|jgi:small-conductance mechanosensitive channel|nr:mechanosensitive ion channel family protein [Gaiellaceae bacterium]
MYLGVPHWAVQLVVVGVVALVALTLQYVLRVLVVRWAAAAPHGASDLIRDRRRETAVAVISSTLRYLVFAVAAFILIGFFLHNVLTAAAGATLAVALVGFGAQRFLQDVLAGVFVLVENQYGVGDFITLEPTHLSGVVESVGLRTTILRNLNGDRYIVPNGQVNGVQRLSHGYRSYAIDVLTHSPDEAAKALADVIAISPIGSARFLRRPRVTEQHEVDDAVLVRIRAEVPPTMEWLVEQFLVKSLAARLGGSLAAEPLVYTLDEAAVHRYERTVVVN